MRKQVQKIFTSTRFDKQTMMFSATMSGEIKNLVRKFLDTPFEIILDDKNLNLDGLKQAFVNLEDKEKNRKVYNMLKNFNYNQAIVFVKSGRRADALCHILKKSEIKAKFIHAHMDKIKRQRTFQSIKEGKTKVIIATDVFCRGMDFININFVVNYDMPKDSDSYLHRVGRAGRFGTKGVTVSLVSGEEEKKILEEIQGRFENKIVEMTGDFDLKSSL